MLMNVSKVMIIDDSEADQFICHDMISEYDGNIEILQAYDGLEALEILELQAVAPDAIFLDINMPRMNGHEFLEAYNKIEKKKSIVIVMLTSSNQNEDKQQSLAYNCVKTYFLKPLEVIDLEKLFKNL